ncbi:MAG: redoxin domain-containing protein [Armatimonadetes bacterium]|nr:redoxin domain-containing protein [Armatimonadota bacterium]
MLQPGLPAPRVGGILSTGDGVEIGEPAGKPQVIFFFPRAFTPGCTRESCSFRDASGATGALRAATVYGISRDAPERLADFRNENQLPFETVSDPFGEIARAYRALHFGGLIPLVRRVTYVLDADAVVRGAYADELHPLRHSVWAAEQVRRLTAATPPAS